VWQPVYVVVSFGNLGWIYFLATYVDIDPVDYSRLFLSLIFLTCCMLPHNFIPDVEYGM